MRTLYFDCFSGASGDMTVGALLDLGVDVEMFKRQLSSLNVNGYSIKISRTSRLGIAATKFDVNVEAEQPARHLPDIRAIINKSELSETTRARALQVFERLAKAEAKVHGTDEKQVHFHEVGAVDSIVDVVGALIAFELLGVERFFASPLRVGSGTIRTAHGLLPVPAPATAELLRGVPIYAGDIEGEFVTPTAAALLKCLCESFGPMPPIRIEGVGYGAGTRNPAEIPNVLRLVLGESGDESVLTSEGDVVATQVMVIETTIDDMNPQVYGFVLERAFALGALDVFLTPVYMKKQRPGMLITVLCEHTRLELLSDMLLKETTTLGVRYHEASRRVLERVIETAQTEYGPIRIKVAREGNRTLHFQPEYDDCARVAAEAGAPLIEVQAAASAAYRNRLKGEEGD
ncbi:MAG TPA: nickel pincer cofactor biosynthesis protein LarC [Blastocatellia bacterium]|nr:nickel pincer cofactor biosynthesis protein LarC [Blastocatellia bacterium]